MYDPMDVDFKDQQITFIGVTLHGAELENWFRVPYNITLITYNCPQTLYHSSESMWKLLLDNVNYRMDVLNTILTYFPVALDYSVYLPNTLTNDLKLFYDSEDPNWKLGVFKSLDDTHGVLSPTSRLTRIEANKMASRFLNPCIKSIFNIDYPEEMTSLELQSLTLNEHRYTAFMVGETKQQFKLPQSIFNLLTFNQYTDKPLLSRLLNWISVLFPRENVIVYLFACRDTGNTDTHIQGIPLYEYYSKIYPSYKFDDMLEKYTFNDVTYIYFTNRYYQQQAVLNQDLFRFQMLKLVSNEFSHGFKVKFIADKRLNYQIRRILVDEMKFKLVDKEVELLNFYIPVDDQFVYECIIDGLCTKMTNLASFKYPITKNRKRKNKSKRGRRSK